MASRIATEVGKASGFGQAAIDFVLADDVVKHLGDGDDAAGLFVADAEGRRATRC